MGIVINILIIFCVFAISVWWFFFAPQRLTDFVENAFFRFMIAIFDFLEFARTVIALATIGIYFIGRLGTMIVLGLSLFIFINEVSHIYGYRVFSSDPIYQEWLTLFGKSYSWAAITVIVASTVAINNVLKYELDLKQYIQKQKEQLQEKVK